MGSRGCLAILFTLSFASLQGFQAPRRDALSDFSQSVRALTKKVSPAVVQILVSGYGPANDGEGQQVSLLSRQRSTGSGVIVDPDGYIITNAHVVRGAVNVRVLIAGARKPVSDEPVDAKIVGIDRGTDLALIKVDRKGLQALRFGDSDSLNQGDIVLAVGSPLGLKNSVSMGVVSAPARQISDDNPLAYIQTDASINPGNSGGALVNVEGQLMGVNSFIFTQSGGSQGIGFAIPSNMVQNVYQQLKKQGHVHRGEIGVAVQDITPVLAAALKLPVHAGVIVADISPGSPSEMAGLKHRDIVTALDGRPMEYARDFELTFYRRQKGDKVSIKILRDGQELAQPVVVDVDEQEEDGDALADSVKPENNLVPRLGILCIEVDSKIAKMLPDLRQPDGLIVAAKSPDGQGRYIDLQPADVIHTLNDQPVGSLETFRAIIAGMKTGEPVALLVERSGTFRYISFEIE
jgi:serine protease Do